MDDADRQCRRVLPDPFRPADSSCLENLVAVIDMSLRRFDRDHGAGQALHLLQQAAESDAAIRIYLERVAAENAGSAMPRTRASVEETLKKITTSTRSQLGMGYWGRNAEPDELEPILHLALSDAKPIVLENALRCLSGSKTLALHPELFPLLHHDAADVRLFCARTLARHADPRVREAGLSALRDDTAVALELLRKNALPEDGAAILDALRPFSDVNYQHAVGCDIVQLWEEGPALREPQLALYVYEFSPCQICRGAAVRTLLKWNACPSWLLEEGRYDASEEVRELCATPSET